MGALEEIGKRTNWYTKPTYPKDRSAIQAVVDLYSNPCDAPWVVYLETALPALGIALLEYLDFGVMDVVRGFAKPAQLGRRAHGSRRRRARSKMPGLPDIGDEIGKSLRPDAFYRRTISDGQRHLWVIYGGIERLLWWWMVADIAQNFAYNWASAIYEEAHCSRANDLRGSRSNSGFATLIPNREEGVAGGPVDYWVPGPPPLISWGVSCPPGYRLQATLAGSYVPNNPNNPPQGVEIGFFVTPEGAAPSGATSHAQPQGDEFHMVSTTRARPGVTLYPYTRFSGGGQPLWTNMRLVWFATPV